MLNLMLKLASSECPIVGCAASVVPLGCSFSCSGYFSSVVPLVVPWVVPSVVPY